MHRGCSCPKGRRLSGSEAGLIVSTGVSRGCPRTPSALGVLHRPDLPSHQLQASSDAPFEPGISAALRGPAHSGRGLQLALEALTLMGSGLLHAD